MLSDPHFYLVAIPAVLLVGMAKGGFAGSFGILAVPVMALVVSPVQAAAILLPILCVMDLVSIHAYRGRWITAELKLLIPPAIAGVVIGAFFFGTLNTALVRVLLGVIAIAFTLQYYTKTYLFPKYSDSLAGAKSGLFLGTLSGFTSFVAHAGGPPLSMYLLRRGIDRTSYVATAAMFFTAINYVKLIPYAWLGQLDTGNFTTSLVLMPLAPLGVALGVWCHKRVSEAFFYRFAYAMLLCVGIKLLWDGVS